MPEWIKLHRKILDSQVFSDSPELFMVWIYCLAKAAHKPEFTRISTGPGKTSIELAPGQLSFSKREAAAQMKMSATSVYNRMQKLVEMGNISIKGDHHRSIVTITNWETYQNGFKQVGPSGDHQLTITSPKKIPVSFPPEFEQFWEIYPRKVGKSAAFAAWKKIELTPERLDDILSSVTWHMQSRDWMRDGGKFIPNPSTYLNQGRWMDSPPPGAIESSEEPF
jgi:hypothetical protein